MLWRWAEEIKQEEGSCFLPKPLGELICVLILFSLAHHSVHWIKLAKFNILPNPLSLINLSSNCILTQQCPWLSVVHLLYFLFCCANQWGYLNIPQVTAFLMNTFLLKNYLCYHVQINSRIQWKVSTALLMHTQIWELAYFLAKSSKSVSELQVNWNY